MERLLADLFDERPWQWGLRGDPFLWKEMQGNLEDAEWPNSETELQQRLEQAFQELVGVPIGHLGNVFIEHFAHGGMSSGYVMPEFWREHAIPLLLQRYRELTED